MRKTVAMVFAGGRVDDLSVLTERRPKAAVVFGGIYRTIDFALTNLANAGVGRVGILAQYRPSSLIDHVGTGFAWDLTGTTREVRFLPPSISAESKDWYRGPADALYQNIDFIERTGANDVIAMSGDHVCSMDLQPLLRYHQEHGADLTMAFTPVEQNASRFGIGELNSEGQLVHFTEKPEYPRTNLASMSIYVFRRSVLVDELRHATQGEDHTFQIHEVLRRMMPRRLAYGWVYHGDWGYTRTLDEYYAFHQDLLGQSPRVRLDRWGVRSNVMARRTAPPAPTRCLPGSSVENSLVATGCTIAGTVRNSVLSPGVRIERGALVENCILWDDVVVQEGAVLRQVVSDKRAKFGPRCIVGEGDSPPNETMPQSLTCGATVVGMDAEVGAGGRIGKNCIIYPDVKEGTLPATVPSGATVVRKEVVR